MEGQGLYGIYIRLLQQTLQLHPATWPLQWVGHIAGQAILLAQLADTCKVIGLIMSRLRSVNVQMCGHLYVAGAVVAVNGNSATGQPAGPASAVTTGCAVPGP